MKETPIPFSCEMVRAIIDGRKTMTRRVIKPQPHYIESSGRWAWPIPKAMQHGCDTVYTASREWHEYLLPHQNPYGAPGDRLWVRETWRPDHSEADIYYKADGACIRYLDRDEDWFRKDWQSGSGSRNQGKWRPSIFMPRWASRITLEVTKVRVERLQDISEADAKAEGLLAWSDPPRITTIHYGLTRADVWETNPRKAFARIWNDINAKRGYSFESNPWVWVVEFKRVAAEGGE